MKKLPIGTQAFEVLRKDGAIYIDRREGKRKSILNNRI
jgi:hypothetical protein